MQTVKSY